MSSTWETTSSTRETVRSRHSDNAEAGAGAGGFGKVTRRTGHVWESSRHVQEGLGEVTRRKGHVHEGSERSRGRAQKGAEHVPCPALNSGWWGPSEIAGVLGSQEPLYVDRPTSARVDLSICNTWCDNQVERSPEAVQTLPIREFLHQQV
jgi:hypothetical protein